ncbi:MAG: glutamine--fructose-6-phosphate aminotransferase, partial [Desulfobacteraceae bacterium]|nr:glutamine--fructose-6-phosphate aminotransferase [Desulfobacteraceae bacterium]
MKLNKYLNKLLGINIEVGKSINNAKNNSIILFPYTPNRFNCGISALVAYKGKDKDDKPDILGQIETLVKKIQKNSIISDSDKDTNLINKNYLGGNNTLVNLLNSAHILRENKPFLSIVSEQSRESRIKKITKTLSDIIATAKNDFKQKMAILPQKEVKIISERLEKLQDTFWCLEKEVLNNIEKINNLIIRRSESKNNCSIQIYKQINAVLNSLDRLEVRGRDSSGVSLIFTFTKDEFEKFRASLIEEGLSDRLKQR